MAKLKLRVVLECKHKIEFSGDTAVAIKEALALNCRPCGARRNVADVKIL